jgi:hypothetical protein
MRILAFMLSLYFLAGSLMPGSDWDELPKMANLIEHYKEHSEISNGKITFADFISLHYATDSDHSQEGDCKLPFHHCYTAAFTAVIQQCEFRLITPHFYLPQPAPHPTKETRDHVASVFQPPQLG